MILEYLKQKNAEKSEQQMILHLKRLDEYLMEIKKGLTEEEKRFSTKGTMVILQQI